MDSRDLEIIGIYFKEICGDPGGMEKLRIFMNTYKMAYSHAIDEACEEIHGWWSNMDPFHEGTTSGLLREVESDVRNLKP